MKYTNRSKLYMSIIAGLVILVLTGCSTAAALSGVNNFLKSPQQPSNLAQPAQQVIESSPVITVEGGVLPLENTLEQIYTKVNPGVVNIRVVQKVSSQDLGSLQIPNFPFFSLPQGDEQSPEQYQSGLGSGFVWDEQGHIITNNHVIDGADKIEVTFNDGTIVQAELIGTDPDSDLSVLKVDLPDGILPLQLTDSSSLKVGQLAVAIGNPFGLEGTMTVGIISALGRSLPASEGLGPVYTIPDIIQTDAPINPGNSGGVLVDDQGNVIGVTAAIESPVRANAGIGFAIPSAIVQKVVPALISDGHFDHAWLGISGTTLIPDLSTAMDLDSSQRGVLVIDVMPNSPAEKSGLQGSSRQIELEGTQTRVGGDVIVSIDDQPLNAMDDLIAYLVGKTEVGQHVNLTILRDGKEKTLEITLAARPSNDENSESLTGSMKGAHLGIFGLDMNEAIAQTMDLPQNTQGVLVEQVEVGSPADDAGIKGSYKPFTIEDQEIYVGGDVITSIDNQSITGIKDLQNILSNMEPGDKVSLTILRDGQQIKVPVTLGE
jgi:serine protease Do